MKPPVHHPFPATPNLVCPLGHWHWAPEPERFAGRSCLHAEVRTITGDALASGKCQELLTLV